MLDESDKLIFINYRRTDASESAHWLYDKLENTFINLRLFIDDKDISPGRRWEECIEEHLKKASVLIVIIGSRWVQNLRSNDLDDWVCKEIEYAINNKITIIPVLVSNTELPSKKNLPLSISSLLNYQVFKLRTEYWNDDLQYLFKELEKKGFTRKDINDEEIVYPYPHVINTKILTNRELDEELKNLPQWKRKERKSNGLRVIELIRKYEFETFEAAIEFMFIAARHVSRIGHHPTWQNTWRTIIVSLTTWDIGHKPSKYDIELAKYLDKLYVDYEPQNTKFMFKMNRPLLEQIDRLVEIGNFLNRDEAVQVAVEKSLEDFNPS
jgi:pterin-4a-carbinolamine dehydratase